MTDPSPQTASLVEVERAKNASAEDVAKVFHDAYESLAPSFGYKTREASAVPWEQVPKENRDLMCAVAGIVWRTFAGPLASTITRLEQERDAFQMALEEETEQHGDARSRIEVLEGTLRPLEVKG